MLTKNKNPRLNYISRVLALPLAVIVIAAFTLKPKTITHIASAKKITVVVDAGHGGKDNGAQNPSGNILEKDVALAIAKKIKELNTDPNLAIVLTREDDTYQSPQEKVAFAKAQHADLFISIHLDGASRQDIDNKNGMSIIIGKNEFPNVSSSRLLASAIIGQFKNNYPLTVPAQPQQRQIGIAVLQQNNCPAVLIEAGYITSKKDLDYLLTESAKNTFAQNVLAAVTKYANSTTASAQ